MDVPAALVLDGRNEDPALTDAELLLDAPESVLLEDPEVAPADVPESVLLEAGKLVPPDPAPEADVAAVADVPAALVELLVFAGLSPRSTQ